MRNIEKGWKIRMKKNYIFNQTSPEDLKVMNEFKARFFRREELKLKEEREKQQYLARRRLEELKKYN